MEHLFPYHWTGHTGWPMLRIIQIALGNSLALAIYTATVIGVIKVLW